MKRLYSILIALTTFFFILHFSATAQDNMSFTRTAESEQLQWGNCPAFMPESCEIAVLNGDPAKPDADIFFKMHGNTTVSNHWHHSAERMVLVYGEMEVNYEGQSPAVLSTGTYAFGPPEKPHSASCISDEPCVLFIAFSKPVDAFAVE